MACVPGFLSAYSATDLRVIQLRFDSCWETSPAASAEPIKASACRPATAIHSLATQFRCVQRSFPAETGSRLEHALDHRSDGGIGVFGHSGGSAALSYTLAHYGGGDVIDFAQVSGGPVFGRMDVGCASTNTDVVVCPGDPPLTTKFTPPAALCVDFWSGLGDKASCGMAPGALTSSGSSSTSASGRAVCGASPTAAQVNAAFRKRFFSLEFVPHAGGVLQLERWRNGSVVSAGAQYDFPQTLVSFWYCKHDQNNAAGQGSFFANAVRTTTVAGGSTCSHTSGMLAVCSGQGSRTPGHVSSHVRRWNLLRRRGVQRSASGRGDGRGDGARDRGSPRAGNVTAADQNLFSFRHIHLLDFLPCGAQIYLGLVYRFRRHSGRCILNLPVGAEDGRTIGDRNPRRGCVVDAGRCGNSRRREPETALCRVRVGIGEVG